MTNKYQPYSEIIDIQSELKEYKKLCDGKSKNYKYYLDWKSVIANKMSGLDSDEKRDNFKHFLINRKRSSENINEIYIPVTTCCITILLNAITIILSDIYRMKWIMFFIIICLLLWNVRSFLKDYKKNSMEYCFYCDLIDIMEGK